VTAHALYWSHGELMALDWHDLLAWYEQAAAVSGAKVE
jgi:hypothetical protein